MKLSIYRSMSIISIVLIGLGSCNGNKEQSKKIGSIKYDSPTITNKDTFNKTGDLVSNDSLQTFSYSKSVYDEYFTSEIKKFLKDSMNEWTVPNPDEWDNLWFQTYRNPASLVNYITGDFNCDNKRDYAVLLADKSKAISAWVIQSNNSGFTKIKLEDCGTFENHIQVGLELIDPGKLDYIDPEKDGVLKPIILKCPAIQVEYFESAATTYYWNKNKYSSAVTGD
jgi:hypothetical protein